MHSGLDLGQAATNANALLLNDDSHGQNLTKQALTAFQRSAGQVRVEQIVEYVYAVLNSPSFRNRCALPRRDVPRIPLPRSSGLFDDLARLGSELVRLHLLESPRVRRPITEFIGGRSVRVEEISWSKDTVWVDRAQSAGFKGVREEVWDFHIGSDQVCKKWLRDRRGWKLPKDDVTHYQEIVVALSETIRVMREIDEVIEQHGGWPTAFRPGAGRGEWKARTEGEPKEHGRASWCEARAFDT